MLAYTQLAHEEFGTKVFGTLSSEHAVWDIKSEMGLTTAQTSVLYEKIRQSETFWTTLPPLLKPRTFFDLDSLCVDHDVYFVTARPGTNVRWQTKDWLASQGVYGANVIVSKRKGEIASGLGAHYALDDKAGNSVFIKYASPKTRSFILDRSYNQFDTRYIGSKVERIASVEDFLKIVNT